MWYIHARTVRVYLLALVRHALGRGLPREPISERKNLFHQTPPFGESVRILAAPPSHDLRTDSLVQVSLVAALVNGLITSLSIRVGVTCLWCPLCRGRIADSSTLFPRAGCEAQATSTTLASTCNKRQSGGRFSKRER